MQSERFAHMDDFLVFRRMVSPIVIEALFWLLCLGAIGSGITEIARGVHGAHRELWTGIALLLVGPFVARLYCELMIVVFRINETLSDIHQLAVWAAERTYALGDDAEAPEQ